MSRADSSAWADTLEKRCRLVLLVKQLSTAENAAKDLFASFNTATGRWDKPGTKYVLDYSTVNDSVGTVHFNGKTVSWADNPWYAHLRWTAQLFDVIGHPNSSLHGDPTYCAVASAAIESYLKTKRDLTSKNSVVNYRHPFADIEENGPFAKFVLHARSLPKLFPQATVERWANYGVITQRANSCDLDPRVPANLQCFMDGANLDWVSGPMTAFALVQSKTTNRLHRLDTIYDNYWRLYGTRWPLRSEIRSFAADGLEYTHNTVYNGGDYGFSNNIYKSRLRNAGTPWAPPFAIDTLLSNVLMDATVQITQVWPDVQALGKSIRNVSGGKKTGTYADGLIGQGLPRDQELRAFKAWNQGVAAWPFPERAFRFFNTADYATKHFPKHMVTQRAVAISTPGIQSFGSSNTSYDLGDHAFFPLGGSFIYRDGSEYLNAGVKPDSNVFNQFDFARVPGVTTAHITRDQIRQAWPLTKNGSDAHGIVHGSTEFAGGVESGSRGVLGWQQAKNVQFEDQSSSSHKQGLCPCVGKPISVPGHAATFFLDDAVVHLGAGFDVSVQNAPTFTSMEQRRSQGETWYGTASGSRLLAKGDRVSDPGISWVWHDSVGYLVATPNNTSKIVVQDVVQTKLADIPGNVGIASQSVFSTWIDHGNAGTNVSFHWAAVPGTDRGALAALAKVPTWQALSNTASLQAVRVPSIKWTGIVFHASGEILSSTANPISVASNASSVVAVRETTDSVYLDLADLQHGHDDHPGTVTLKLGTHLVGTGFVWDAAAQRSVVAVALPVGAKAGSTVHLSAKKSGTSGLDPLAGAASFRVRLEGGRLVIDVGESGMANLLDLFRLDGRHVARFMLKASSDRLAQVFLTGMPRGMLLAKLSQNARVLDQQRILLP